MILFKLLPFLICPVTPSCSAWVKRELLLENKVMWLRSEEAFYRREYGHKVDAEVLNLTSHPEMQMKGQWNFTPRSPDSLSDKDTLLSVGDNVKQPELS